MRETKKFEWEMVDVEKLLIHSISGEISIGKNLERKISLEVELSGFKKDIEEYQPHVKMDGRRIEIDLFPHTPFFPDGFFAFGFLKFGVLEIQNVYLKIPDDLSLGIETTSGDTEINEVAFNELRLSSVSGNLNVKSEKIKSLFLKTTSGDVNIGKISSNLKEMELQSISGDINLEGGAFDHGRVKTTSGDIRLMNVDPKFESLDVKTISGDFSISFTSRPNVRVEIETVSGDVKSDVNIVKGKLAHGAFEVGNPSSTLKFKSISGDATFKFGSSNESDTNRRSENKESKKDADERLQIFEEILKSKRATKEEIRELMITIGYKEEEIEEFLSNR